MQSITSRRSAHHLINIQFTNIKKLLIFKGLLAKPDFHLKPTKFEGIVMTENSEKFQVIKVNPQKNTFSISENFLLKKINRFMISKFPKA